MKKLILLVICLPSLLNCDTNDVYPKEVDPKYLLIDKEPANKPQAVRFRPQEKHVESPAEQWGPMSGSQFGAH